MISHEQAPDEQLYKFMKLLDLIGPEVCKQNRTITQNI